MSPDATRGAGTASQGTNATREEVTGLVEGGGAVPRAHEPPGVARATRAACAGLLAAILVVLGAGGAGARDDADQDAGGSANGLGLEVVRGYGGETGQSAWTPVAVFLAPDRPVRAELTVRADAPGPGEVTESRPIEVAAGARTVHRFLVPARRVTVVLDESDREPVTVEADPGPPGRGFLAGVLGATPRGLPGLQAEETRMSGTWVPVDGAWLERSMVALEPLGTLVAEREELVGLSPEASANLAAGIVAGTDLVVVADADGPLELEELGLPAVPAVAAASERVPTGDGDPPATVRTLEPDAQAWTMTAGDLVDEADESADAVLAAASDAGRGRVTVVGVEPGDTAFGRGRALWEELVGPGSHEIRTAHGLRGGSQQLNALFADGQDRELPSLPWFPVFLTAYVVVVGPVNWFVLARLGRRELAWVTVPAVTAVFTAAAFLGAVSEQPPAGTAGRVAYWLDGAGGEVVAAGVRSPTPADRDITLPGEGWAVMPQASGEGARVDRGPDTAVLLSLEALEPGGAVGRRARQDAPPLRVEAVAGRQGTDVTVSNTADAAVEDVEVRVATARAHVGDLPAGDRETVSLDGPRLPFGGSGSPFGPHPPGHPESAEGLEQLVTPSLLDDSPGIAWVTGSLDEQTSGVRVDGKPADHAGTLLAVGVSVRPPDHGVVAPMAVRRSFHGGPALDVMSPSFVELSDELVLRYRLPAGGDLGRLHGDLERSDGDLPQHADIAVWDRRERRWLPHADALAGGADPARFVSPLGQVYARVSGDHTPFEFSARTVSGIDVTEEAQ